MTVSIYISDNLF